MGFNSVPKSSQSNCGTPDKMPALPSFPLSSIQHIEGRTAIPCDPSLHGKMEMKVSRKQCKLSTDEKMGRFDYRVENPACVTLSKEHEKRCGRLLENVFNVSGHRVNSPAYKQSQQINKRQKGKIEK